MRIAIIADCYIPMRSSAAVMIEDLAVEFQSQGHTAIVITPDSQITIPVETTLEKGVHVLRVKAPHTKDVGYVRRTLSELYMPYLMLRRFRKSDFSELALDGIVWYSPSIFHGPLVKALKKANGCKSYLILRDIFPEWAVDMGIMRRGLPYRFFKLMEAYQYSVADTIGVQSPANCKYLHKWAVPDKRKIEVLHNWLADAENSGCCITLNSTSLVGRKIFVYAGNMGVAQGLEPFIDVIERLDQIRDDIGFLFVGRGSEVKKLRREVVERKLDNVLFFNEIPHQDIPGLYAQCHFGLVILDPRHRTHNIPGKFISYMKNGLPVLACINDGNDMLDLIAIRGVGRAYVGICIDEVVSGITEMVDKLDCELDASNRCKVLALELFSSETAVRQILGSFK